MSETLPKTMAVHLQHAVRLIAELTQCDRDDRTALETTLRDLSRMASVCERDRIRDRLSVEAVTRIMRQADEDFQRVGGSTRHHVRDCLLPRLLVWLGLDESSVQVTMVDVSMDDMAESAVRQARETITHNLMAEFNSDGVGFDEERGVSYITEQGRAILLRLVSGIEEVAEKSAIRELEWAIALLDGVNDPLDLSRARVSIHRRLRQLQNDDPTGPGPTCDCGGARS